MALLLAPAAFAYPQPVHAGDKAEVMAAQNMANTGPDRAYWTVTGTCALENDGKCVTDGSGDYANNEDCTITSLGPGFFAKFTQFSLEAANGDTSGTAPYVHNQCDDFVRIHGVNYCGYNMPDEKWYENGNEVKFESDWVKQNKGFKLCAVDSPP